jgi:hypothetical protein
VFSNVVLIPLRVSTAVDVSAVASLEVVVSLMARVTEAVGVVQ